MAKGWNESLTRQNTPAILELHVAFVNGRVFTTLFSGRLASDNRKSHVLIKFKPPNKVAKRVGN